MNNKIQWKLLLTMCRMYSRHELELYTIVREGCCIVRMNSDNSIVAVMFNKDDVDALFAEFI